jgi:DNA-binding FrmR family transcriptional regulator
VEEVLREEDVIRELEHRLSRIEGQIRGIRTMTTEGRPCLDTVTQIAAVRGALRRVADIVVASHVERWVQQAAAGNSDPKDGHEVQDVQELLKVFGRY